jgi:hypothetical protein
MLNQSSLDQFIGTEGYHRWSILFRNHVLTDGAKYVADNGGTNGAYWLMDAIASYHGKLMRNKDTRLRDIQFWNLKVNGNTAVLTCRADSGEKPAVTQKIEYTDFDLPEIDLWVQPGGDGLWVIMLKSEY